MERTLEQSIFSGITRTEIVEKTTVPAKAAKNLAKKVTAVLEKKEGDIKINEAIKTAEKD